MASDTTPAMIYHRTWCLHAESGCLAHLIIEKGMVKPECVAQSIDITAVVPLLPVKPPEIHSLLFKRTDDGIEEGIRPLSLTYSERYRGFFASLAYRIIIACILIWSVIYEILRTVVL